MQLRKTPTSSVSHFVAPVAGEMVALVDVPDPIFADGVLGSGYAVIPDSDGVCAPVNGVISAIPESKHAVYITGIAGEIVLVHVGIDTVSLEGQYLEVLVSEGQSVTAGQPIMRCDFTAIAAAGFRTHTIVCLVDAGPYKPITTDASGAVRGGDVVAHTVRTTP